MKKIEDCVCPSSKGFWRLFSMLAITVFLMVTSIGNARGIGQNERVSLDLKNVDITTVFKRIEEQTAYKFFYKTGQVEGMMDLTVQVKDETVKEVLDQVLKGTKYTYSMVDKQIVILKETASQQQQKITVHGVVKDEKGETLPGVSILIKGTTNGIATDVNGNFTITVSPKDILQFNYMGMKMVEKAVPANGVLNVVMEDDSKALEEVVVTGYGNFKKSSYTGAASVVQTDRLQSLPVASITQMMEANIPGVSFDPASTSGQPGSNMSLRIRGRGSINASVQPLYVLDGVPVISGNASSDDNSNGGLGFIATLNPADIENITVLKDAASASLYGARGANGVVLITTKKGRQGRTSYNLKASYGLSDFAYTYRQIMGGEERRNLVYEGFVNSQLDAGKTLEQAQLYADGQIDVYAKKPVNGYADWKDALFRLGHQQEYDLSATGGNEKNSFAASVGYSKQEGVSINSGFERFSGRMTYNAKMNKVDLLMSSMFSLTQNKKTPEGTYYASAVYSSRIKLNPSDPIYNEDGSYNTDLANNSNYNPVYENKLNDYYTRVARSLNSMTVGYTIIPGLRLQTLFNVDYSLTKEFRYWSPLSADGKTEPKGEGHMAMYEKLRYNSNTMLTWMKAFGNHHLDAAVAYELQHSDNEALTARAKGYGQLLNNSLSNATLPTRIAQPKSEDAMISYVGRANYDYNNKYYFGFSFRRDGSSRLASGHKWENFWAVSGSWRVTAEPFMESTGKWLTDLKVRGSYGVNGNLPSDYWGYYGMYLTDASYNDQSVIYEGNLANPDLSWEKNYAANVGLDILLINRINVTFDWYRRVTKDLLMEKQVDPLTGFGSVLANIGSLLNKGVELEIRSMNIQKKDFSWTTSLNLAYNKNKVLKLADLPEYQDGRFLRKEGKSFGTLYLRQYAGVDPDNGKPMYYDNVKDADGTYSRNIVNDPNKANPIALQDIYPKVTGGLNNIFTYKFVDLAFNLSFSLGGHSYDNGGWSLEDDGYSSTGNKSIKLRNRWQKPGDKTNVPRYVAGQEFAGYWHSSRFIHSTDHLRLKSFILGVSAPKSWLTAVGFSKARIYFSGTNLLTWAAYDQYDPEMSGAVAYNVPPLKTWAFGIELGF